MPANIDKLRRYEDRLADMQQLQKVRRAGNLPMFAGVLQRGGWQVLRQAHM